MNIPRLNDKIELSFNFEGEILNSCFLQKLFHLLVDRDISNSELQKMAGSQEI